MSSDGPAATGEAALLREAVAADGPAIAALHIASWRSAYRGMLSDAFLDGPIEAERGAVWESRFAGVADPNLIVVVAEDGGRPGPLLGFGCILIAHDPVWGSLVDNLHVDPAHRRRRIGRHLLARAATLVGGASAERPIHLFVLDANLKARAAYESWGGRCVERFDHVESDGASHPIRRYAWASPREFANRLARDP